MYDAFMDMTTCNIIQYSAGMSAQYANRVMAIFWLSYKNVDIIRVGATRRVVMSHIAQTNCRSIAPWCLTRLFYIFTLAGYGTLACISICFSIQIFSIFAHHYRIVVISVRRAIHA